MARFLLLILLLIGCNFSAYSQAERWDPKNCIYSNYHFGFSWTFPSDVTWEKIVGTEKHTVFKVVQPDTDITAFVNVNRVESNETDAIDIWKTYDNIVANYKKIDKYIEENTGMKTVSHTFEKCIFCGKPAYKSYHHSSFIDDRYDEPLEVISLTYSYAYKGFTFMVTIKSYKSVYEIIEKYIQDIFKGYIIVNSYD